MIKKLSFLYILGAGILWGCIGLFVRTLNSYGLASMQIVVLRTWVTAITMFVFLLIFNKKLLKIKLKDLWCFLGTGIASIVFFNYCYFKAITETSLAVAAVLLYTAPIIVMLLSFLLFHEAFNKRKALAVIMTVAGCALVTGILTDSGRVSPEGILLGLGAGLGYALYSIFSRFAIERGYGSMTITFYTFLFAAIASPFLTDCRTVISTITLSAGRCIFAVAFGIVCTVIPYLLYTLGLRHVENTKASILASIEPVTATVLGNVLYGEVLSRPTVLGIVLVIAAMLICS